jgi:transposase
VPIDNNHIENQLRPSALGRRNWLFIGSQVAGERAAVVMVRISANVTDGFGNVTGSSGRC